MANNTEVTTMVNTNRNTIHLHLVVIGGEVEVSLQVVEVHQCHRHLAEDLKEEEGFPHLLHISRLGVGVSVVVDLEGVGDLLTAVEEEIGDDSIQALNYALKQCQIPISLFTCY
jgi:hypothetical protein